MAAAEFGHDVRIAHPKGYDLDVDLLAEIERKASSEGGSVEFTNDIEAAFDRVDAVYAKSWGSKNFYGNADADVTERSQYRDKWIVDREKMSTH